MVMAASMLTVVAETKTIAHRGFWRAEGSAQNSIASLEKADAEGCYGSEFDVWLTTDSKLVVNHDATFKGHVMEKSSFAEATAIKLDNGENLPSLEQYLKAGKKCKTKLILELKAHSTAEKENEAVDKIVAMVKKFGLQKKVEYISFSLNACRQFIKKAPKGTPVYYLNGELSPEQLKEEGFAGMDYHLSVIRDKHPEWTEEAHKLGLKVNCWTIDNAADMLWLIEHGVDFITTDEPAVLQKLLKETYGNK